MLYLDWATVDFKFFQPVGVSPQLHQDPDGASKSKLGSSEEGSEPAVNRAVRPNLWSERELHNLARYEVFAHLELLYEQVAEVRMIILCSHKQGMEASQIAPAWMP